MCVWGWGGVCEEGCEWGWEGGVYGDGEGVCMWMGRVCVWGWGRCVCGDGEGVCGNGEVCVWGDGEGVRMWRWVCVDVEVCIWEWGSVWGDGVVCVGGWRSVCVGIGRYVHGDEEVCVHRLCT